jgi:hypothetical protein
VHQLWFRERATAMKKDPRYTPDTVVDSFPWPQNVTPERAGPVAAAMKAILDYRDELMRDGLSLNDMYATFADEGANRLRDLHHALDDAVIAAYNFSADDDVLEQLLALNLSIAAEEDAGITHHADPATLACPARD